MIRQNQLRTAAILIVVLIGLGLRVYRLDAQSFWYDEGNSARIAERSLQLIIEGAAGDIHPPLYYVVLHLWRAVAGDSEFGLRLLSVACGTLLVLFTYLLGARMFSPRISLVAAILTAFSPFEVYYSQEARMYVMLALLATISTWALAELRGEKEQRRRFAGEEETLRGRRGALFATVYVLATTAGLYTQYAYPFVMAAQGVCVVLWLIANRSDRRRNLLAYAAMNIVAMALFLPWLPIAIRQITSWGVEPQRYDAGAAMLDSYRWLVVGRTLPLEQAYMPLAIVAFFALFSLAIWLLRLRSRKGFTLAPLMLFIMAALPFALLFAFNLYREAYLKFLLVCVAPLMLLTAYGLSNLFGMLGRKLGSPRTKTLAEGALTFVVILVVMLPSLNNLYHNPSYARDDYRGIARALEANARPDDAILFNAPNQWEVFTYYHRAGAPAVPLIYRPPDDAAVDGQLKPIAEQYARLFVLYYGERESDPSSRFERWLAENAYAADVQWVGNIRLATYATHPPSLMRAITATFGTGLTLVSASFDGGDKTAGDVIPVQLQWHADAKPAARDKVFIHIGGADSPPVAQNDAEPLAGFHPTDSWNAGEDVIDRRAVWVKPGVAPGKYGVYIGMYDSVTGLRLPVSTPQDSVGGDRLLIGEINIVASK